MDKSEKVLGMGYLYKSPSKSRDKANIRKCWKRRWCVFSEITYSGESGKDVKLVLKYFVDRDSYGKDEQQKGQLNITECSIRTQFKTQAGFGHIFTIECLDDGRFVMFSASSCEIKLKWIALLCKYKFRDGLELGNRLSEYGAIERLSSACVSMDSNESRRERGDSISLDSDNSSVFDDKDRDFLLREPTERCDSGTSSNSTVSSSSSALEKAPSLPPRRNQSQEWKVSVLGSEAQSSRDDQRRNSGTSSVWAISTAVNTVEKALAMPPTCRQERKSSLNGNEAESPRDAQRCDSGTFSISTISSSGSTLETSPALPPLRSQNKETKPRSVENEVQSPREGQRCDSGTFSVSTISSSGSTLEKPPPLPPRRNASQDEVKAFGDLQKEAGKASTLPPMSKTRQAEKKKSNEVNEEENKEPYVIVNYNGDEERFYTLCEICQKDTKPKERKSPLRRISLRRKTGPRNEAEADEMIEIDRSESETYAREPSIPDLGSLSSDGSFSLGDQAAALNTGIYEDIEETYSKAKKINENRKDEKLTLEDYEDFGYYPPMNIFTPNMSEGEYYEKKNIETEEENKQENKNLENMVEVSQQKSELEENVYVENDTASNEKEVMIESEVDGTMEDLGANGKVVFSMNL